ncbi:hypothetical protein GQ55_1G191800 [Panicum hallii var. hallii]|uniref:Uncharacterized protein n=1 Tax=Panicum hallii var. hallii TaxID=1504633 RepID=A0A2T7F691_9POAL|nr:hypothetical protein GQ55_1G191800 [Panicum hallii var. hallii]
MHIPQQLGIEPEQVTDTYPLSRDQNFGMVYDVTSAVEAEASSSIQNCMSMSPNEHLSAYKKILAACARFRRAISCRGDDSLHESPTRHRLQVSVHTQPTPCRPRVHLHTQPSR